MHEIVALRDIAKNLSPQVASSDRAESSSANKSKAFTLGIYQSIGMRRQLFQVVCSHIGVLGYKEFHDYLTTSNPSDKTFNDAVERMKMSTRQYAKRQISWLRNKLIPAIYASNADYEGQALAYLLDASGKVLWDLVDHFSAEMPGRSRRKMGRQCPRSWAEDYRRYVTCSNAVRCTFWRNVSDFLGFHDLPDPKSLSDAARELLSVSEKPTESVLISRKVHGQILTVLELSPTAVLLARRRINCQICSIDDEPVMIEEGREWDLHVKSRTHKKLVARMKRLKDGIQTSRHSIETREICYDYNVSWCAWRNFWEGHQHSDRDINYKYNEMMLWCSQPYYLISSWRPTESANPPNPPNHLPHVHASNDGAGSKCCWQCAQRHSWR